MKLALMLCLFAVLKVGMQSRPCLQQLGCPQDSQGYYSPMACILNDSACVDLQHTNDSVLKEDGDCVRRHNRRRKRARKVAHKRLTPRIPIDSPGESHQYSDEDNQNEQERNSTIVHKLEPQYAAAEVSSQDTCSAKQIELFAAVESGNLQQVIQMVKAAKKADNIKFLRDPKENQNVLHYAASIGNDTIVKQLITHFKEDLLLSYYPVNRSGLQGKHTVLHILTKNNCSEMISFLLDNVEKTDMLKLLRMETVVDIEGNWPRLFHCLHLAAFYGHTNIVKLYLDYGINKNLQDRRKYTALMWASRKGFNDTVKLLLKKGAESNYGDETGKTALYLAIEYNQIQTVQILLKQGKADPNIQSRVAFKAPIIIASACGRNEIVKHLLLRENLDMSASVRGGKRAIHYAASKGCDDVIEQLVSKDTFVDYQTDFGDTPLILAVQNKRIRIVQFLLENGADMKHRNHKGKDVWHYAMKSDDNELLKILVAAWQKSYLRDIQPLLIAASFGKCDKVQLMLDMNMDYMSADSEGNTLLHHAAMNNKHDIIEHFHEILSIDVQNKLSNTPLHAACLKGQAEAITSLLEHQASSDIQNAKGETALHAAAQCTYISPETVKQLVKYTIKHHSWEKLNIKDLQGNNCLHIAGKFSEPKVMWEFRHVCLKAKNNDGYTPLHQSVRSEEPKALAMMIHIFEQTTRDAILNEQGTRTKATVLHLAVDACHAKCVKKLIDLGADISLKDSAGDTILHRLSRASGEDHDQVERYMEVIKVILETSAKWYRIYFPECDKQEDTLNCQRKATLYVVNEIYNNEKLSVLHQAITVGAVEVVSHLLMLPKVTMIENQTNKSVIFDLAGMTPRTIDAMQEFVVSHSLDSGNLVSGQEIKRQPANSLEHSNLCISGVEWIVAHTPRDKVAQILDIPPIRMIEKYYTSMVARTFILLMILHITYMSVFTHVGLRMLSKLRDDPTQNNFDSETILVYVFVPIEPLLIVIYVVYTFSRHVITRNFGKRSRKSKKRGLTKIAHIAASYASIMTCLIFAALVIAWIVLLNIRYSYQDYVLAAAICIGWLSSIAFTRGIRRIHYFYKMLIKMILIDVAMTLFVYVFVIMAFGFAFHVLFQVSKDVINEFPSPGDTLFLTFNMMIGMDEIFTDAFETNMASAGRSTTYIKLFYVLYIALAMIVLLNLLIAMMNDSYQRIMCNNQVIWRKESIELGIEMECNFPPTTKLTTVKLINTNSPLGGNEYKTKNKRWFVTVPSLEYMKFKNHITNQSSSQDDVFTRLENIEQLLTETNKKLNYLTDLKERKAKH